MLQYSFEQPHFIKFADINTKTISTNDKAIFFGGDLSKTFWNLLFGRCKTFWNLLFGRLFVLEDNECKSVDLDVEA